MADKHQELSNYYEILSVPQKVPKNPKMEENPQIYSLKHFHTIYLQLLLKLAQHESNIKLCSFAHQELDR